MLAKEVLEKVRYSLSDTAKDRWSDKRLLSLLNEGIRDIAKNTILFTETLFYQVNNLVVDIELEEQSLKTLRAEYLDEPLPFYSLEQMDKKDKKWHLERGNKIKAIVYDKQRNGRFKTYPIIENHINEHIIYDSMYGVITDISYSDIQPTISSVYGDLASIPDEALIKFYYVRKHTKVTDINETLYIDELVETPLKHYIVGHALRDNQDVQNRNMANEDLRLYYSMVEEYAVQKEMGFVEPNYKTGYNPND